MSESNPLEIRGAGGKSVLVCSTGGHLSELLRVESRLGIHEDSLWVTFDTPQSRQELEGRRVHHLPYVGARDPLSVLKVGPVVRSLVRSEQFSAAISTGSSIALTALAACAMSGIPSTFIESVCRVHGPSTTGRLMQRIPGLDLRTQHARWAGGRWKPYPSVLEDFQSETVLPAQEPLRIFVTLGTFQGYRFDSVIDAFLATGLANADTVWQLGDTSRDDRLPGTVHDYMSPADFAQAAAEADVVVAHAGVGTLLELLGMGIYPVQVVRRAARKEHVDDHQTEIAEYVNATGIGIAVDGPDLTADVIRYAAQRRIVDGKAVRNTVGYRG
ncbi:glycosyltransferase [Microbacterium sp. NPDC019599]|uniref:glycosyltransferase n=1 Tax=Microbacterium sp. NPDC019599 TaxID=3154690 RepID=UPI0033FA411D